jgi:hypothetical protein
MTARVCADIQIWYLQNTKQSVKHYNVMFAPNISEVLSINIFSVGNGGSNFLLPLKSHMFLLKTTHSHDLKYRFLRLPTTFQNSNLKILANE